MVFWFVLLVGLFLGWFGFISGTAESNAVFPYFNLSFFGVWRILQS